jgi:acyl-CoA synthetase (AMP-forming)/AMP-acid ligase II
MLMIVVQIDYTSVMHGVHRLSGIASPANVAYSASELTHQLKTSGAKLLFTCAPVLETALQSAKDAGIPEDKVIILELPGFPSPSKFKTVDDLIDLGRKSAELDALQWAKGQGARQVAFLCYSSGTSGLPVSRHSELPCLVEEEY